MKRTREQSVYIVKRSSDGHIVGSFSDSEKANEVAVRSQIEYIEKEVGIYQSFKRFENFTWFLTLERLQNSEKYNKLNLKCHHTVELVKVNGEEGTKKVKLTNVSDAMEDALLKYVKAHNTSKNDSCYTILVKDRGSIVIYLMDPELHQSRYSERFRESHRGEYHAHTYEKRLGGQTLLPVFGTLLDVFRHLDDFVHWDEKDVNSVTLPGGLEFPIVKGPHEDFLYDTPEMVEKVLEACPVVDHDVEESSIKKI